MVKATINYYQTGNARPISSQYQIAESDVERMIIARFNLSATSTLPYADYAAVTYSDGCAYTVIRDGNGIRFVDHREY